MIYGVGMSICCLNGLILLADNNLPHKTLLSTQTVFIIEASEPVLNVVWVMFPITLTLSGFVYLRMREYHNLFMFEFVEREFDWTVETSKWVFTFLLKVEKPINLFVYS